MNLQETIRRVLREEAKISTYVKRRMECFEDYINKLETGEETIPVRTRQLDWSVYQIVLTAYMRSHCDIFDFYGERLRKWYDKQLRRIK
jgi:hypothetical protein